MIPAWRALLASGLAALMLASQPAQAQGRPRLDYAAVLDRAEGQAAPIARLAWSGPVNLVVAQSAGEVVVSYDRRVDDDAVQRFLAEAGDRLARAEWAYDTLVLRAAPGWRLQLEAVGNVLVLGFEPLLEAQPLGSAPVASETQLLLARAELAAGLSGRALGRLQNLAAEDPQDGQVQLALAEAEATNGDPARASRRLQQLAMAPGGLDPALVPVAARIARQAGPQMRVEAIGRDSRLFDQQDAAAELRVPATDSTQLTAGARLVFAQANGLVLEGAGPVDADVTRVVSQLGASSRIGPSARISYEAVALDALDVVGGRLVASIGAPEARLSAQVGWHVPDVLTPDGILRRGWSDRAGLGFALRTLGGLSLRADGSVIRYGAGDGFGSLETARIDGAAEYILRRGGPYLALAYRLDGEYVLSQRAAAGEQVYQPLVTRENHTLDATASMAIGDEIALTGVGGWTFDRFGGDGPVASLGLDIFPQGAWQFGLVGGVSSVSRPGLGAEAYRYLQIGITHRSGE